MPVDFLSAAQAAAYGRYGEPPSVAQLERFFHFDERDRTLIDRRRGGHNRLGFAVQLGTVRFLGTFLARPAEVPEVVARRVAEEVSVRDPACLADYARREPTHREHAGEIQREYGYRDFSERSAQADLLEWLDARAWATAERPSVVFDLATARLIEAKVLLPGATVLARSVAAARDRAAARLHRALAAAASDEQRRGLEGLLDVSVGEQLSHLEVLRAGPRKLTASEVAEAFARLEAVRAVGLPVATAQFRTLSVRRGWRWSRRRARWLAWCGRIVARQRPVQSQLSAAVPLLDAAVSACSLSPGIATLDAVRQDRRV